MDRSLGARRDGAKAAPPSASRLTFKRRGNRRKTQPGSVWSKLPKPAVIADACSRVLRRSVPALIGLAVLGTVGGTAWAGYRFVTHSPRFAITNIDVSGNRQVATDEIASTVPAHVGDNVFAVDLDEVARAAKTNPWIAQAEAHRVLPHTITVSVREHVAAAVVELSGLYLADEAGHPFKKADLTLDEGAGLPIITGLDRATFNANPDGGAAQVRAALDALARWNDSSDRPSIGELHLDPHGNLTLVTYEHAIKIRLGVANDFLATRLATFDATWNELSSSERSRMRAIHLDAHSDQVTVAFAPEKDQ
ncbi:MAG TPA: FtsQ-type POTRA domain-containing protein [Kofleriaceae bacterium]|nr:FtsQ-type POTRA domain-containing protein [Kofleriaceae bacterium]